ncbi:major facilitator superfamily domain-containing protein [Mycena vulgaris]|nr:major facilitator superfamily domain-containing protein [Mycena vulgaris]
MSDLDKSSAKSAGDVAVYDIRSSEEKRLRSKLDRRIMPLVCLLYGMFATRLEPFCFLDRVNVGFASLAGLQKSLGLHGVQYNIGLTCFYTTYVVIEAPSNLLGKHFGMGKWLAGCAFGFGICCLASAFVRNFGEFCLVRALLGVFEGGMLPGIAFWLSKFYRRRELTQRSPVAVSLVLASSNIGAACGGLIASGILKIDHIGWLKTWRNIFLIEGLITTVVALCIFFLMIDSPMHASWLTEEEKILAIGRIESEYPAVNEVAQHTRAQTLRQGLLNINTWLVSIGFLFINIAVQGAAVFLPTVIGSLFPGKTSIEKQLLSVPPYFFAALVQVIVPWISMRVDTRGPFMAGHAAVGIIGYAIFVGSSSAHARYAACFLVAGGAFPFGAFSPGLVAVNTGPDATRAVALGVVASVGNVGGIIASPFPSSPPRVLTASRQSTWTYVSSDAPNYRKGNTLNLAGMAIVLAITAATIVYMKWENAQRARGARDHRLIGLAPGEESQLGHLHPEFRYKI